MAIFYNKLRDHSRLGKLPVGFYMVLSMSYIQWIGLRENLQATIDFPSKYGALL